ncbi:hypothetical protein ACLMJK_000518 [Lecanora helva]
MSLATMNNPSEANLSDQDPTTVAEQHSKMKYKSYKKKFLKMRHRFKERMRENGRFYEEEQHATKIARRLQEQNEYMNPNAQLVQQQLKLQDVNDKAQIPPRLRYDLRSPTPNASDVPGLEPDTDTKENKEIEVAKAVLIEARAEYEDGQIGMDEYRNYETLLFEKIEASQAVNTPRTLKDLSRISYTKLAKVPPSGMPADLVEEPLPGYLSPSHEDEYLSALDNHIASVPPDAQPLLPRQPRPTEKEKERDTQLHNPVSVYNWLRAHADTKPVVHDFEKENAPSEPSSHKPKPSPKPPSSGANGSSKPSRKRASSNLVQKQEPEEELLDDEGNVINDGGEAPITKGKRKRDGDDAYRPKGGSSKKKKAKGNSGVAVKKLEPEIEEEDEEV